jgi:hypothetical protein
MPVKALLHILLLIGLLASASWPHPVLAGPMSHDPKGFLGIPWGSPLAERPDLTQVDQATRVKMYSPKPGPPTIGDIPIESLQLMTIDEKFGRVTIRYVGQATHARIMAYLQMQYGPIDRTPGSMVRGLNQQFNWRGDDTEVNLTFEAMRDRGYLFIESRTLSARILEAIGDTGSGY